MYITTSTYSILVIGQDAWNDIYVRLKEAGEESFHKYVKSDKIIFGEVALVKQKTSSLDR